MATPARASAKTPRGPKQPSDPKPAKSSATPARKSAEDAAPVSSTRLSPLSPIQPPRLASASLSTTATGKTVSPAIAVILAIFTAGIYHLFFWWRVTRETDGLTPGARAHPLARPAIIIQACASVVIIVTFIAALALFLTTDFTADPNSNDPEMLQRFEQVFEENTGALVGLMVLLFLAFVVQFVGSIMLYVAQYRAWTSLRQFETAGGRADPVNPVLYLFLPLGLSLGGGLVPGVGFLVQLAGSVMALVFLAKTQHHLNDVWAGSGASPQQEPRWAPAS